MIPHIVDHLAGRLILLFHPLVILILKLALLLPDLKLCSKLLVP